MPENKPMELRQLRYFVKAAECLSFTKAARSLCIAESSLSVQIKQLEAELDTPLFNRERKQIELTEAGEKLLPYAKLVMSNMQDASMVIRDINEMRSGSLRIGGIFSLCSLLTDTLVRFTEEYPQIKVKMVCKSGRRLFELLRDNELDFVLTFDAPNQDELLDSLELFSTTLAVLVHKDHPLAKQEQISLAALCEYRLALPERGMHVRDVIEERFPDLMQKLNAQLELNDVNILYQLINTKHWISIMPHSLEQDNPDLRAIKLIEKNTEIRAALYWRKGRFQKTATKIFIEMLQKHLNESIVVYYYKNKIY